MTCTSGKGLAELKEKTAQITEELAALDHCLNRPKQSSGQLELDTRYLHEARRFLRLKTAANLDLWKLIDHISVNRDGTVRIILKKLGKG